MKIGGRCCVPSTVPLSQSIGPTWVGLDSLYTTGEWTGTSPTHSISCWVIGSGRPWLWVRRMVFRKGTLAKFASCPRPRQPGCNSSSMNLSSSLLDIFRTAQAVKHCLTRTVGKVERTIKDHWEWLHSVHCHLDVREVFTQVSRAHTLRALRGTLTTWLATTLTNDFSLSILSFVTFLITLLIPSLILTHGQVVYWPFPFGFPLPFDLPFEEYENPFGPFPCLGPEPSDYFGSPVVVWQKVHLKNNPPWAELLSFAPIFCTHQFLMWVIEFFCSTCTYGFDIVRFLFGDIWATDGILFREYCFEGENSLSSAPNSVSSPKQIGEFALARK